MKAVLQYRASPGFLVRLRKAQPSWLDVVVVDEADKQTFVEEMLDADVLLHVLEPVTAEVINASPTLKFIQKIGVGVNTIDLTSAAKRNIAVANMPGTNSQAVAELAIALMMATLRQVVFFDKETRAGRGWTAELSSIDRMGELGARTLGLVGYGEVGRRVARIADAFGARVIYHDIAEVSEAIGEAQPREVIFAEADIISLHVPLVAETNKLINAATLARMKSGAILINTARGGLVDEPALVAALKSGHLRAAGLDVFQREPVEMDNELLSLDNVVVMPHLSWLTPETLARSLAIAIENCRRVREGDELLHQIEMS
jgi:phosphoglycerate dehydrogenase-like enzyme